MMIPPLLLVVGAATIGAMTLGVWFGRRGRWLGLAGLGIGAAAGALGSLVFMYPLGFCTFESGRGDYDVAFGLILIGIGIAAVLAPVGWLGERLLRRRSLFADNPEPTQGMFKTWWMAIPLLTPTLAILLLFLYYPSLETLRLSTHLARLGARREAFICVNNFTMLVDRPQYWETVERTLLMSVGIVMLSMGLALLIATMAYLPVKGAAIYRTLLVWPYAISPAVAGLIFLLMFNPAGRVVNHFSGEWLGVKPGWLNDPKVAPWTIILTSVWKSMGFNILFYIAALQNVPKDLLEAGSIDGAGALRRFWHIVWPLLSPTTFFLIVTNMTYAFFETYATIDYLTPGGGPLQSTTTMMYQVIQLGVDNRDLGKAAAQSLVLFVMVLGMTALLFRSGGRRVNYGA